jgi:hypothetical protein
VINPKEIDIMSATNSLSAYLNDHLADETLGLELARRASAEHKSERLGTFLELLSWELEEDRDALLRLMGELGVHRNRVGVVSARIAERVRHLRVAGASPSNTLAELEALDARINGKLHMWNALRSTVGDRVDGIDFEKLIRDAEHQRGALEQRRVAASA